MQLPSAITFPTVLLLVLTEHVAFAFPALIIILAFNLIDPRAALFIYSIFTLLNVPVVSWITWLIAKGSGWVNTVPAIKVAGIMAGQFFGFFLGALIGVRLLDTMWGILGGILFFLLGRILGTKLGAVLAVRYVQNNPIDS